MISLDDLVRGFKAQLDEVAPNAGLPAWQQAYRLVMLNMSLKILATFPTAATGGPILFAPDETKGPHNAIRRKCPDNETEDETPGSQEQSEITVVEDIGAVGDGFKRERASAEFLELPRFTLGIAEPGETFKPG
jgi:hypothetical protein